MVGYVYYVIGKKKFLIQLKYVQKRGMSSCLLSYLFSNDEVVKEVDEPMYDLPLKEQG